MITFNTVSHPFFGIRVVYVTMHGQYVLCALLQKNRTPLTARAQMEQKQHCLLFIKTKIT